MNTFPSHSKPIASVMKTKNHDLQQLFEKLYEIARLKKIILPLCDQTLRTYIDISYDFKHTLILIVANDAIATRIRFQKEHLLKAMQQITAFQHITNVSIKLTSHQHHPKRKKPFARMALLSQKSVDAIQMSAENMTHPALKAIMQRIATRKQK